jgi:uncharacterized heparinase superfamily protein
MTGVGTFLRTVVHLRPAQVLGRARLLLPRPQPDLRPAPALRQASGPWVLPARRGPSLLGPTQFRFLSAARELDTCGWDDASVPLLWRYNLHYFDDLNAEGADDRDAWHTSLIQRWMAENPPGQGTAWAPYPTSLRIVNWIKRSHRRGGPQAIGEAEVHSLAVQARWLARRLEWHLLGNHLFVNAKALVHAGLFFQGPEADAWLRTGLSILQRELPEQVLRDGGHFERSPMYHALALEDLLDLANLFRRYEGDRPAMQWVSALSTAAAERAPSMLRWLRLMSHPDGAMARFNDCAEGIAPALPELARVTSALGLAAGNDEPASDARLLDPSGYVRMAAGPAVLIADVAPIGPDYLPGHAHADSLSYELSVGGRQLVVNRGTSEYGMGPRRQLERGTAAHSTVQLGASDSSEVWAGFRVGRRARVRNVVLRGLDLGAEHDGYRFLPGAPVHRRRWRMDGSTLLVEDEVSPAAAGTSRHHLSPGLGLKADGPTGWSVLEAGRVLARAEVLAGTARIAAWQHALGFGELAPAQTLELELQGGRAALRWHW